MTAVAVGQLWRSMERLQRKRAPQGTQRARGAWKAAQAAQVGAVAAAAAAIGQQTVPCSAHWRARRQTARTVVLLRNQCAATVLEALLGLKQVLRA